MKKGKGILMDVLFIYPQWGSTNLPLPIFLERIKKSGYNGIEMGLPLDAQECKKVFSLAKDFDLEIIAQHYHTDNSCFESHKESFQKHLYIFAEKEPLMINSHTGKDFFSFKQNAELLVLADKIEEETGIPIIHETHRSRFSFAAHVCEKYLIDFPFLKLTADLSHWCCVAESMLSDQSKTVELAIENTWHVHARVGSSQSAQVIDPRIDVFESELIQFKEWWKKMLESANRRGLPFLTFTPEYGPAPYQQVHPNTKKVLADQWEINEFIRLELKSLI